MAGADNQLSTFLASREKGHAGHPACRRREAQPGFRMERENLDGDAKGNVATPSRSPGMLRAARRSPS
jgi:hypothetical protein